MGRVKAVHVHAALAMVSVLPTFVVEHAWAQECSNQECGPGYVCETSTGVLCTSVCDGDAGPNAADAAARDAGILPPWSSDGGKPDDGGWDPCWTSVCEPHEYHSCAPAPCTADSECPSNMRCHTSTWQECSGGGGWACEPGTSCEVDGGAYDADAGSPYADAGPVTCTERSESSCTLRIHLPCEADDDCGEGYECAESRWYGCSGGGSVTPAGDGGWIFEDAGSSCEWYSGGTYCKLLELPCDDDSACPNDMRCQPSYQYSPCDASVADANDDADGGTPVCPPAVVTTTCQPWYDPPGDAGATIGGGGYADGSVPPGGGGTPGSGGTPGGGAVGGASERDAGAGPGSSDAGNGDEDDDDDHGQHGGGLLRRLLQHLFGNGGCSVSGSAAPGNMGWLSLLGLGLLARRRRG